MKLSYEARISCAGTFQRAKLTHLVCDRLARLLLLRLELGELDLHVLVAERWSVKKE